MALLMIDIPYAKTGAFVLYIIAAITDWLDGILARKVYGTSDFGKLMDPLADKVMVGAVFISLVEVQLPHWPQALIPAWIVVLIISREFMVTGLRLLAIENGKVIAAGPLGKYKTIMQMLVSVAILGALAYRFDIAEQSHDFIHFDTTLGKASFWGMCAVCLITVISGWKYFAESRELLFKPKGKDFYEY